MANTVELVRCDVSYDKEDDEHVKIKLMYRENGNLITTQPIYASPDLLTELVHRELTTLGIIDGRKDDETCH